MLSIIGPFAACLTTLSFVPQAIQVIKTKDVSGISSGMYSMFVLGVLLWTIHGIRIWDLSLIAANGITFVLAAIILGCKIKYK